MESLKIFFWIALFVVFYTYLGYGLVLYALVLIKRGLANLLEDESSTPELTELPEVTIFIPAYNEKEMVDQKMRNTRNLNYPKDKLKIIWVTDGSNDGTNRLLESYDDIHLFHKTERKGKINAMNRVMPFVETPFVVFSDANTNLSQDSIMHIIRCFKDPKVGCVSGEKRIVNNISDTAAGSGEGLYWKYESKLKKWDAELYSAVGAAGELFAIRTDLYEEVEQDTILDDFIISLRIVQKGYVIQYNPEAYAVETSSQNITEELKRKIRISAGGIQSVIRMKRLMNIFKYGILSFQFVSHRVLRWTLTPMCLIALTPITFVLAYKEGLLEFGFFSSFLMFQLSMYAIAVLGWLLENKSIRVKVLFVPYYFLIMNISVILGFFRFLKGGQSVNWVRAKRAI
jgi:cellulose synthase/poly-beta-1,6-N-acetylglucosamine synthase-like glycosyltransferase